MKSEIAVQIALSFSVNGRRQRHSTTELGTVLIISVLTRPSIFGKMFFFRKFLHENESAEVSNSQYVLTKLKVLDLQM